MSKNPREAYLLSILELLTLAAQSKPLPPIEKNERGQLVRDLYDHWVILGGRNAGHPVRSVRQMKEWLGPDKKIRSLEPKLSGRTNLGPEDAKILFELFLSRWHSNDPPGNEEPYADMNLNDIVARLLIAFYSHSETRNDRGFLLPARSNKTKEKPAKKIETLRDARSVIAELFSTSDALITVSQNRTVSDSPASVRQFQNLFDTLRNIDRTDNNDRLLIWIVDIGRRQTDDAGLLALRNLDALAFQFRAIALTDHPERKERWNWMKERTVVIVGSLQSVDIEQCYKNLNLSVVAENLDIPRFSATLLFLSETPDAWVTAEELRLLYG